MNQPVKLSTMQQSAVASRQPDIMPGFGSAQSFELLQRQANLLSQTTLVPASYRRFIEKTDKYGNVTEQRENPNAIANSVVALNMAQRMGSDPLMVMQNLYIVEGRPSWSSQWIIAAINGCGRFSPLRFDIKQLGDKAVEAISYEWQDGANGRRQRVETRATHKIKDKRCIAWAVEKGVEIPTFRPEDLRRSSLLELCKEYGVPVVESPAVTIEMAVQEGWYQKNGSKWKTMDEVMLRYRAASFFGKIYAPELLMGLTTVEEAQDAIDVTPQSDGTYAVTVDSLRDAAASAGAPGGTSHSPSVDTVTGEIFDNDDDQLHELEQAGQQPQASEGPTFEDAIGAVKKGDYDIARDLARGLADGQKLAVEQAINNAQQTPPAPQRQRRNRDQGGLGIE